MPWSLFTALSGPNEQPRNPFAKEWGIYPDNNKLEPLQTNEEVQALPSTSKQETLQTNEEDLSPSNKQDTDIEEEGQIKDLLANESPPL
jgi:hypothetical protein